MVEPILQSTCLALSEETRPSCGVYAGTIVNEDAICEKEAGIRVVAPTGLTTGTLAPKNPTNLSKYVS
jgi:hypothetical protein